MSQPTRPKRGKLRTLYEIFYCLVLTGSLGLVAFDYTYLATVPYTNYTVRDVYLKLSKKYEFLKHKDEQPILFYDPMKGIEYHRNTVKYLKLVKHFQLALAQSGDELSPEVILQIEVLKKESVRMINKSPFKTAHKNGTLELIKNRMRLRFPEVGKPVREHSSKYAFREFWNPKNFSPEKRKVEMDFFNQKIAPLINTNYYRGIDADGEQKDYFYKYVDIWFVLFFWFDFLLRWLSAGLRGNLRKWYLFPVRNWFYIFTLLVPHHMAWIRIMRLLPLYSRIKENGWLPGGGLLSDLIHSNAGVIAEEISGMVMVNIVSQIQSILKRKDLGKLDISESKTLTEVQNLAVHQIEIISEHMVPQIQPEINKIVEFSINKALEPYLNSPLGPALRLVMGQVHASVGEGLHAALAAPEGIEKLKGILRTSLQGILKGVTSPENLAELQQNLDMVLGEVKKELVEAISEK